MATGIDDESEPADIVFGNWNEKAPLLGDGLPFAAGRGDAFDKALRLIGVDGRNDDSVGSMLFFERTLILRAGFARC